ncbi:MAG: tetratricopeptide repeat protein [Xanthobacteraceae bacterium]
MIKPKFSSRDRGELTRDAIQSASLALRAERAEEAERIARALLQADAFNIPALRVLGYAMLMQDRFEDTIKLLGDAARRCRDSELDTQIAIALRRTGKLADALSKLKRATKRQPPFPAAFHELGLLLGAMNRDNEAIIAFSGGLKIAPLMPELSLELGFALLRQKRLAEAKSAFSQALAISPRSFCGFSGLAGAHQQAGEYQAAVRCLRQALLIEPSDQNTWISLGHCLLRTGQRDAGFDCFRTAARSDSKWYGKALSSLASSGRGRAWLKPSGAARFMRELKT